MRKSLAMMMLVGTLGVSGCFFETKDEPYREVVSEQKAQCVAMFNAPLFAPIRDKIELFATESPPPNAYLPDMVKRSELPALRDFIGLYARCNNDLLDSETHVLNQLYALYSAKIPWGQFTNNRYAIINGAAAQVIARDQRMLQEYHTRQYQQFQQMIKAWRPPPTLTTTCNRDIFGSYTCTTELPRN